MAGYLEIALGSLKKEPQLLAVALAQAEFRGLSPATHSVALPEPKPGTMCQPLIVSSIGRREVAPAQWPAVRHDEHAFQPLNFGNRLLRIHPPQSSRQSSDRSNGAASELPPRPSARTDRSNRDQVKISRRYALSYGQEISRTNRAPEDGPPNLQQNKNSLKAGVPKLLRLGVIQKSVGRVPSGSRNPGQRSREIRRSLCSRPS